MENYFDVHKILGGQETGVKIIGGPSTPLSPLCRRPWVLRNERLLHNSTTEELR